MAAYNTEAYISQAIESVLAQTHADLEIIIVNDGSKDGTLKIVEAYAKKDPRIVVITQANQGVSAARNTGLRAAQGDYFCFFDSDDIMLPTKVASQLAFLESNQSADFVYSNAYYFIDGADDIYRHDLATASGSQVYAKLLQQGNFIYTGTVFFKRSVFDKFGGFDETLRSTEEFDYWLTLSQHGVVFMHQDAYLTLCRSRGNGLTSDSVTMYATAVAVFEKHLPDSFARITSRQYIKSRILLFVSHLRKPKTAAKNNSAGPAHNSLSLSYYVNILFGLLKKIKFSMTFRKIHDKKLQEFLISIENRHGSTY